MAAKKIETELMTVTPALCTGWLEANENNRPLHQHIINQYARDMVKKEWDLNGESLKFDTKSNILDGQHRMWACIESDSSFRTLVTTGLPRKSFDTLDTGLNRKASDILGINGEVSVNLLASTLRHIGYYYGNSMLGGNRFTNRDIEGLLDQHPDVREYVKRGNTNHVKWCAGSVIATCWYLASRKNKGIADAFFESLSTGTNLTAGSPVLILRNKFIDVQASAAQKLTSIEKIEMIINAWNLHRKGKTVKHFKLASLSKSSDEFPIFK